MHELSDDQEKLVLGELLKDRLDVITELVSDIPHIRADVNVLREDVNQLKTDVRLIKAVVTDQSHELAEHRVAIGELQQAT